MEYEGIVRVVPFAFKFPDAECLLNLLLAEGWQLLKIEIMERTADDGVDYLIVVGVLGRKDV